MAEKEQPGSAETPDNASELKEVASWLKTITYTQKWSEQIGQKAGWKRFVDEYKGDWTFLAQGVSIPIVPVNLVYAYSKTEIARLYFRDPWITVNAKRKEDVGAAQIAEQVLNYMWGELNLKAEVKRALLEAILVGHSWIKTGYVAEFGTEEAQPKKRGPGRPPKKEAEVDANQYLKNENAFAYYVPYKDVLFDPSATFPVTHNARWMAHKIVRPMRAIKESGIYQHTDAIKPSLYMEDDFKSDTKSDGEKGVESAILWEIYDLDHMKITTVSPGCEYKLREIDYPDYLNGELPFTQIAFNFVPGDPYPLSDIAPHEPQIIEITKMMAIELNHLKRWNRQIIVAPDFFSSEEEAKFKDGNDGAIIKANVTAGSSLESNFYIPPYAPVQQDVYGMWNQIMDVWRNISGQSDLERGANQRTATRTLGELRLQLQGGRARADEKVDVLEDAIAEVARKLLKIFQKKMDLPKIARIVGPQRIQDALAKNLPNRSSAQPQINGEANPVADKSVTTDFSFSWNKTDVMGDMDVDVVAGSTIPLDKDTQLEIMEKLIPLLPAVGAGPGTPAAKAYGREMLRLIGIMSLETVIDLADQAPPQPNPELMKAQVEMQAKQQETQGKQQLMQAQLQAKTQESQLKLQTQTQEAQLKLQLEKEKLEIQRQKAQMDMQKQIIQNLLSQQRAAQPVGAANGNGGSDAGV
jgi:hypothetical protein